MDDDALLQQLMAGANGYMTESEAEKFVVKMLDALQRGEAWISRKMVAKLLYLLRLETGV